MRIAVLVACHNRRDTTIRNLVALRTYLAKSDVRSCFIVVDDGSTDGTSYQLAKDLPEAYVVRADGSLYWNRGMCVAYGVSRALGPFDSYLLFNDDVAPIEHGVVHAVRSFANLSTERQTVAVGATVDSSGNTSYSGYRIRSRLRPLDVQLVQISNEVADCDTLNGNFVLVDGALFDEIGGLDPFYHHSYGDTDLGLVANRLGARVVVLPVAVGQCERGESRYASLLRKPRTERFRGLLWGPDNMIHRLYFYWKNCPKLLFPIYLLRTTLTTVWDGLRPIGRGGR